MTPAGAPFVAEFFDGQSARRQSVQADCERDGLRIRLEDGSELRVPFDDIARLPREPGGDRLVRRSQAGWRLDFPNGLPATLTLRLPTVHGYGRWIDRMGLPRAILTFAVVSGLLVAAVVTAPRWIAPLVPRAVEQRIGEALVGDFAEATCHTPAGDAALARLVHELDLPNQPPVRLQVIKFRVVNAVALPGDRIVIFSGLFDQVKDPDAMAGVVAHELGHVRKRHVMQALLREFGLSTLMVGANGAVPANLAQATGLSYSREAESEADAFSRERLAQATISPLPTAAFFDAVARQEREAQWVAMLGSHPQSAQRAKAFKASARQGRRYAAALSAAEWQALARICSDDPKAKDLIGK